jgi:lysyl-tRNA synthetase class 2
VLDLSSAITVPLASRLDALERFAPIAVPETAAVLVALAGIGLLFVARGVRRGQRHAWSIALALLLFSAGGHVVKGLDIEEAILTLLAAAFLAVHASDFTAPADRTASKRGRRPLPGCRSRSWRASSASSCTARCFR